MKHLSLHVARRYLTERESSASRISVALKIKTRAGDEFPFNITQKILFPRSFSSSLDTANGGGGGQAQKFFYDSSCANCES